jgi:hypothetical protein
MSKILTLSIDEELIDFAHDYSRFNGVSISNLVGLYLERLKSGTQPETLNSKTSALFGLFEDNPIPDKKDLRVDFHEKQY